MASQLSVAVVLLCAAGLVLAQTFQYSNGWTPGRKRSGAGAGPLEEPVVAVPREDVDPCQAPFVKYVVAERDGQQMYIPCMRWRNLREQQ